jgi:hypothetical protein
MEQSNQQRQMLWNREKKEDLASAGLFFIVYVPLFGFVGF